MILFFKFSDVRIVSFDKIRDLYGVSILASDILRINITGNLPINGTLGLGIWISKLTDKSCDEFITLTLYSPDNIYYFTFFLYINVY